MKTEKVELERQIRICAEQIMKNRWSWKQFTDWCCNEFDCGMYKSNQMWNKSWELIHNKTSKGIQYSKDSAFIELEELKEQAAQAGDRRVALEIIKYQSKLNKLEDPETQINIQADKIQLSWGNNEK